MSVNAFGLKCFIDSMQDQSGPVFVTFGKFKYQLVNVLDEDGKLVLVALAEGEQNVKC